MQFSLATLITLFAAAASAAPSDNISARQATLTELAIFTNPNDNGCSTRTGTKFIVDRGCQSFAEGINSARIDVDVPVSGCTLRFFNVTGCPTTGAFNTVEFPKDISAHQCFNFGAPKQVKSVLPINCEIS